MVFSSLFYMYVSRNWVDLHQVHLILELISLAIFIIIPESPKFLVQKQEYEDAMHSYNFICQVNSRPRSIDLVWTRFEEQRA